MKYMKNLFKNLILVLLLSLPLQQVLLAHDSRVVIIHSPSGVATGFFISNDLLVTNSHLCINDYDDFVKSFDHKADFFQSYTINMFNGDTLNGTLLKCDIFNDLCIIKTSEKVLSYFHIKSELNEKSSTFLLKISTRFDNDIVLKVLYKDRDYDTYSVVHKNSYKLLSKPNKFREGMSGSAIVDAEDNVRYIFWALNFNGVNGYAIGASSLIDLLSESK